MSTLNRTDAREHKQSERRWRMIRDTESFLARRVNGDGHTRRYAEQTRDRRLDPRKPVVDSEASRSGRGREPSMSAVHTLIAVPTDEHGHVDDELLDQWGIYLSRLIDMPHRGHVLLDLADVAGLPDRFLLVYEWFRRHLARQGRRVFLHIRGACLEGPTAEELSGSLAKAGVARIS